jgi:hypothetical protein
MAPLWILALIGLLFLPTEYRGGAADPHGHALVQLLLDAQDGQFSHAHAHQQAAEGFSYNWLDPAVYDSDSGSTAAQLDLGEQQDRAPALSMISFLIVVPLLPVVPGVHPPIPMETRRLRGRSPRVLIPPPRIAPA